MSYPVFYPIEGDTLPIMFDSFDGGTGASITMTGIAVTDIEIYKDGGTTQRASDSGYTLLDTDGIDFDGITGIHGFSIDLSDNTDSGFFSVGPWYHVVVSSVTIDGQTVNFIAAAFRIVSATRGLAGTALPAAAADAAGGLPISDAGGLDLDNRMPVATAITNLNTVFNTDFATNYDATNDVWVARLTASGLQTDAVEEIRNAITGGAYALSTDANGRVRIVDGTAAGELDTDSGTVLLRAATEAQIDAIEADTNELQTDWVNGGRLDLIIDAILDDTGTSGVALAANSITAAVVADGAIDRATFAADTGLQTIRSNTAQAGGTSAITLDASASSTTDFYNGAIVYITGGTGAGQYAIIRDYNGTTKVATVHPNWRTAPDATSTFALKTVGIADVRLIDTQVVTALASITAGAYIGGTGAAALETTAQSILTDTNELQTDWTNGGRLDLLIDAILDDTGTSGVVVNAAGLATDAVEEIRNAITGGAYALSTDANGMVRIVDGTGSGELNTASGLVALNSVGLDAITFSEPAGEPTFSSTATQHLAFWAALALNKITSDSNSANLRNQADNADICAWALSDDGTTFTSGAAA